jgi:cellulose synthase/poly-beta-1,6-N-acetylglucosamine synthase-like glycosyltransferase
MELVSFIVPAHNEAVEIAGTLKSVFDAARAVGLPFEVIVVNDASTDETKKMAQDAGARVVDVNLRKISAVRNAGARQANGDVFFFVDADTRLAEPVLRAAWEALRRGAVGGGAWVRFTEPVNLAARVGIYLFGFVYARILGWAAGCCIFARRESFLAAGGFDEKFYATEEILLSIALKRQGRFVVLREAVSTSSRKLRIHSLWEIVPFTWRFILHGPSMLRQRDGLDWWYDGRR